MCRASPQSFPSLTARTPGPAHPPALSGAARPWQEGETGAWQAQTWTGLTELYCCGPDPQGMTPAPRGAAQTRPEAPNAARLPCPDSTHRRRGRLPTWAQKLATCCVQVACLPPGS